MLDHDRRQLEWMRWQIQKYRERKVDLSGLISSLESLRHALMQVPEDWIDRFWSSWGTLEVIYSVRVVGDEAPSSDDDRTVDATILHIEGLIDDLLRDSPPDE